MWKYLNREIECAETRPPGACRTATNKEDLTGAPKNVFLFTGKFRPCLRSDSNTTVNKNTFVFLDSFCVFPHNYCKFHFIQMENVQLCELLKFCNPYPNLLDHFLNGKLLDTNIFNIFWPEVGSTFTQVLE